MCHCTDIVRQAETKRGAEGTVVLAEHVGSGNAVAIKFHKHRETRDYRYLHGCLGPNPVYLSHGQAPAPLVFSSMRLPLANLARNTWPSLLLT